MAEMIKAHPLTVRGVEYEVFLRPDGHFVANVGGGEISSPYMEGLVSKIQDATRKKKAKVEVPFYYLDSPRYIRKGVATGIHESNNSILVRWSDGEAMQFKSYHTEAVLRPLSDEEEAELMRLVAAKDKAYADLTEFRQPLQLRLRSAVEDAVNRALRALEEAEETKT